MTEQKVRSRPSRGPYSAVSRGTKDMMGKCHLIAHTTKEDQEIPICLSCPYERCVLDGAGPPRVWHPANHGRRPDPSVVVRNAQIVAMLAHGHRPRDIAAHFGISVSLVYNVRSKAGAPKLRSRPVIQLRDPRSAPRKGAGRPPDPLLRARNRQIVHLRNAGATGHQLAARFGLKRHSVYNIIDRVRRESQ